MANFYLNLKIVFMSLICTSAVHASYFELTPYCFSEKIVEIKMGYFFFSRAKMRKIYNRGGVDFQLSSSYPLWHLNGQWTVSAYGALEYFHKSGKSINGNQKTSLWSVPINFGLKALYLIDENLCGYFAAGPRYFYLHQHNSSSYVEKNRSRNGLGLFFNTGFYYSLCNGFALDLFGEYSYAKIHLHKRKHRIYTQAVQVGGFTFGSGLVYAF